MKDYPLVSCVMPTANRADFIVRALECFAVQGYPNKELIVFDSGIPTLLSMQESALFSKVIDYIRYIRCDSGLALGTLRNCANMNANGKYIAHFDDDDYSAPDRLSKQVAALEADADLQICGLDQLIFHDLQTDKNYLYTGGKGYLAGGTFCYRKSLWESGGFPDVQIGSDIEFLKLHVQVKKLALNDLQMYVAMIHARNTSPKQIVPPRWDAWKGAIPQHIVQRGPVVC